MSLNNPVGVLALISTIYQQNKNLLETYSNSLAVLLKSKLFDISNGNKEILDLIETYDKCSFKHCALDVNYSYSKPLNVSNFHVIFYDRPEYLISLAGWSYSVCFTDKINLICNLSGKVCDKVDLNGFDESNFRIYLRSLPKGGVGKVELRDLDGFIIEFDRHNINRLTFDGTRSVVRRFVNQEIAQLNLLDSKCLLVGTGKQSFDSRTRILNQFQVVKSDNGQTIYTFNPTVKSVYGNLIDSEVFVDDRERNVYLISMHQDGQIEFIKVEIVSDNVELNVLCIIPPSGLSVSTQRLSPFMVDRLFCNENSNKLQEKYENVLIRFCIYYDTHDLCIFELYGENNGSIQYRIDKLIYEQSNEIFGILCFFGNMIAFENGVYLIGENKVIPFEYQDQINNVRVLSETTILIYSSLTLKFRIWKILSTSTNDRISYEELLQIDEIYLSLYDELFKVVQNGNFIYHDLNDNCLKLIRTHNVMQNSRLESALCHLIPKEKYDWFNEMFPLSDEKILIKLSNSSSICMVDPSTRTIVDSVTENEIQHFRYCDGICVIFTQKSVVVYKYLENAKFLKLDSISHESITVQKLNEKQNNVKFYKNNILIYTYSNKSINLYNYDLQKQNRRDFNVKVDIKQTDIICVTEDCLVLISNSTRRIDHIELNTQCTISSKSFENIDPALRQIGYVKAVDSTNDLIFIDYHQDVDKDHRKCIHYMTYDSKNHRIGLNKLFAGSICRINAFNFYYLHERTLFLTWSLPDKFAAFDLNLVKKSNSFLSASTQIFFVFVQACSLNSTNTLFMAISLNDLRVCKYTNGRIDELIAIIPLTIIVINSFISDNYLSIVDKNGNLFTFFIRNKSYKNSNKVKSEQEFDLNLLINAINQKREYDLPLNTTNHNSKSEQEKNDQNVSFRFLRSGCRKNEFRSPLESQWVILKMKEDLFYYSYQANFNPHAVILGIRFLSFLKRHNGN